MEEETLLAPKKQSYKKRIITSSLLMICVAAGFMLYIHANRQMTVSRNSQYIEDAAMQTMRRIEDTLVSAENSLSTIAFLYGQAINPETPDLTVLQSITDNTPFDYMGIVDTQGIYTDNRGLQAQVSDRFYYQDGMAGNSGIDMIFNGRLARENLMIFYAPLWEDGKVSGILTGRYGENQMQEIISTTYFDMPAATYLCLQDGTIFSCFNDNEQPQNIISALQNAEGADQNTLSELIEALENKQSRSLVYQSSQGFNGAYIANLPGTDWMLLQVFPIQVTNDMLHQSNSLAIYLELWLIGLFVIYILLLIMDNRRQKAKLVLEKQEMQEIVQSTSQLFSKFILVDLQHDSYEYLKSDLSGAQSADAVISQRGVYSQLQEYWSRHIIQDDMQVCHQLTIAAIQQNLTEDIPFLQYEYRIQNDSVLWVQIAVLCLKRNHHIPVSVLMTMQDVTELKEAELKSRMAIEEAYRSAKAANDAKTVFLSNMSHDMRTPMNAIMGFSSLLARDAAQPEKVQEYTGEIAASGQRLLNLINNVLEMSKIESGQSALNIAAFDLRELLESLNQSLQPQAHEKRQSLDMKICDLAQSRFWGDCQRLHDILVNLLSNAIQYTPEGGQIRLTVSELPSLTAGYAHLCFHVQDNGIGISPEYLKHIFTPFWRERNTTASGILGTGLGLAIAKSHVELMGGAISADLSLIHI